MLVRRRYYHDNIYLNEMQGIASQELGQRHRTRPPSYDVAEEKFALNITQDLQDSNKHQKEVLELGRYSSCSLDSFLEERAELSLRLRADLCTMDCDLYT